MAYKYKVGDKVRWNSEAGHVSGIVTRIYTKPFKVNGYTRHASKNNPQYAIKSLISNHIAHHFEKALHKYAFGGEFTSNNNKIVMKKAKDRLKRMDFGGNPPKKKVIPNFGMPSMRRMAELSQDRVDNTSVNGIDSTLAPLVAENNRVNNIVNSSTVAHNNGVIQDRRNRMAKYAANPTFGNSDIEDKMRLFPNDPNSIVDDYLNPLVEIGKMADRLGHARTVGQFAKASIAPVTDGAFLGMEPTSNLRFLSNIVSPTTQIKELANPVELGTRKLIDSFGEPSYAYGGDTPGDRVLPPIIKLNRKTTKPSKDYLEKFANWTGQSDTKVMAADLMKRGLVGADQLLMDEPDLKDPNSVKNSQSDWKPAAIMDILSNARKLNLRTPEEINANRDVLMSVPKYKDAIENPYFNEIHPNFWNIITHSILPQQYAKFDRLDNESPVPNYTPSLAVPNDKISPMVNIPENFSNTSVASMAMGGDIHIKKSHRGRFTAYLERTGSTLEQALHSKDPHVRQMANFARNASKWKHAMGGPANPNAEVEGGEVVQTPDGDLTQMNGPSHEQGGIDVNLPEGSEVFSKRLKLEGKSMAARKVAREKRLEKIEKLLKKNPHDALLRNTASRMVSNINNEDAQDMALQKVAGKIYAPPVDQSEQPEEKYAFGGDNETPFSRYANGVNHIGEFEGDIPYAPLNLPGNYTPSMVSSTNPITLPNMPTYSGSRSSSMGATPISTLGSKPTVGDYVGMAGSLFGAVAPLVNTIANRRNTPPNVNRFRGYGHNALEDNNAAEGYASGMLSNELSDIDTSANSSYARNNNSASSINTSRALNIATDLARNKAKADATDNYSRLMVGLLGQRSQLHNESDLREMNGQTEADTLNAQDRDNYYSNLGDNLSGIGTGIQGIGRDLNITHGNQMDANMISQLSKYGLEFDENGRIVTKRQ